MKKLYKYLFYIIIFLFTGEIIARIHLSLNEVEVFNDFQKEEKNAIDLDKKKIYLLGDSFSKGLGISKEFRLSNQLKISDYILIDRTVSGDDWTDYINHIKNFKDSITDNDIIIIGINWNDIIFKKGDLKKELSSNSKAISNDKKKMSVKDKDGNSFRKFLNFIYLNSKSANFLSSNFQNLLKRKGMALPIGDFNYFRTIGYNEKAEELNYAISYIDKINQNTNSETILYLYPEFNLLNHTKYFNSYTDFYENLNHSKIHVINGVSKFEMIENQNHTQFYLSSHDGHPNASAHLEVSRQIFSYIKNNLVGDN